VPQWGKRGVEEDCIAWNAWGEKQGGPDRQSILRIFLFLFYMWLNVAEKGGTERIVAFWSGVGEKKGR